MRKNNKCRISILVTTQTAHNLHKLAVIGGLRDEGAVVDKLTRDRMVQLHPMPCEFYREER